MNVEDTTQKYKPKKAKSNVFSSQFNNAPSYSIGKENKKVIVKQVSPGVGAYPNQS